MTKNLKILIAVPEIRSSTSTQAWCHFNFFSTNDTRVEAIFSAWIIKKKKKKGRFIITFLAVNFLIMKWNFPLFHIFMLHTKVKWLSSFVLYHNLDISISFPFLVRFFLKMECLFMIWKVLASRISNKMNRKKAFSFNL